MNKKSKLLTIVILILICVVIGVSYAYWQITRTQNDKNIVTTGCFEIESDIGSEDEQMPIRLLKTYPILDSEGKELSPFTFTLRNTCDTYAGYQINLETLNTTTLNLDYLKAVINNETPKLLSEYDVVETTIQDALNSHKLLTGGLKAGASKTFNLRLWLDQDTPLDAGQNKTYEGKVSIIASPETDPTPVKECTAYEITGYTINYENCISEATNRGYTQEQSELFCTDQEVTIEDGDDTYTLSIRNYLDNDMGSTLVGLGLINYTYSNTPATTLTKGLEYTDGTYTYKYMQEHCYDLFANTESWKDIDIDGWGVALTNKSVTKVDTPLCTSINGKPIVSMSSMFVLTSSLSDIDVSSFDTSNVVNMYAMFGGVATNTATLSIRGMEKWDTSKVTNMSGMFSHTGESVLDLKLDLSYLDTSNVTNMYGMFGYTGANSNSLEIKGLENWDTSKIKNMMGMFSNTGYNATTFDIGNLSRWDTSSVTNMQGMFQYAGNKATTFDIGDLSSWDTSNVIYMCDMFYDAGKSATTSSINPLPAWYDENNTSCMEITPGGGSGKDNTNH